MSWGIPPMFSTKSFMILALRYILSWFLCMVLCLIHSFTCRYPIFPIPLLKRLSIRPLNGLGTVVENCLTMFLRAYFWAFLSCWAMCLPLCQYTMFDHCSFVIHCEIRKWELQFCSFSRFFDNWGSLNIAYQFRVDFPFLQKKSLGPW